MTCITEASAKSNTRDRPRCQRQLADSGRSITTRSHPHTASAETRHTHASALLLSGAREHVVMRRLGHADIQTTLNLYGWATEDTELRMLAGWRSFCSGWRDWESG